MRLNHSSLGLVVLTALAPAVAVAEDAYFHLQLSALTLTEGRLPEKSDVSDSRRWQIAPAFQSYAVLDGEGEAYIGGVGLTPCSFPHLQR
jgi:hypothetical protein